jgi:hypothetical protein
VPCPFHLVVSLARTRSSGYKIKHAIDPAVVWLELVEAGVSSTLLHTVTFYLPLFLHHALHEHDCYTLFVISCLVAAAAAVDAATREHPGARRRKSRWLEITVERIASRLASRRTPRSTIFLSPADRDMANLGLCLW